MTYTLLIGDRSYSSWSLRGWLCFAAFDIPVTVEETRLYESGFATDLARFAPARTVPALRLPEGGVLGDSLAIAEELASRHPDAGHWPQAPAARALARGLVAEMHSGFLALREACPMNLRTAYRGVEVAEAMRADLTRIEALWALARAHPRDQDGPWLFGRYSLADVFFAPVAMRIAGYGLSVGPQAQAYVEQHLGDAPFLNWRAKALDQAPQDTYRRDYDAAPWPGPDLGSGA